MTHDVTGLLAQKDALHIMDILAAGGFETRFIGGCVRDTLLQRPVGDIDLATTGLPDAVMAQLLKHNIHVVPTGLEHGTVMAVVNSQGYEITTLRQDVSTDGRRAVVAFTDDWQQDAHRRDFTVNALSVDRDGNLYDYCDGLNDLAAKRLRFIDDAASRIQEDYLRLLRLFRFASVLGWSITDQTLLALCAELAPNMKQLSRERIQAELYKLLGGEDALAIIELMDEHDIFRPWTDKISLPALHDVVTCETRYGLCDTFRRFVAMIGYDDRIVIDEMVVLSKQQKKRLQDIERFVQQQASGWSQAKFCYFFDVQATEDCLVLFAPDNWNYDFFATWQKPSFPLKAEDIMQDVGGANAVLGKILKQTEHWWVDQGFTPDAKSVLAFARQLASAENCPD